MIDNLNINKSNWKLVKLGDVASTKSIRVNNPKESKYERFIGSSCINERDMKVKKWDSSDSVISAMKGFESGDYLFVRRSTHGIEFKKRVPRADFDGICSGDIIPITENKELIHDGFLIGVLYSTNFWKHVISNASGSITSRVKWKDLAEYEFLLPPKDQQNKIAELLWAMDDVVEKKKEVLEKQILFRESSFMDKTDSFSSDTILLKDVLVQKKEKSISPHLQKKYIGLEHIESGSFTCDNYQDSSTVMAQCYKISKGDLCYSKLRPYLDKAFIATFDAISTTELLVYDTKDGIDKDYVLNYFHSQRFLNYTSSQGYGTKMPRVNHKIIGKYQIKSLQQNDQIELMNQINKIQAIIDATNLSIINSKELQKSLINEIFSP